jgi:hypothetical protein
MDRPWKWGEADCCMSADDVFCRLTGIAPSAPLRGTYSSRREAATIINNYGGFIPMCDTLAARAGLRSDEHGQPGDLAVCLTGLGVPSLAICVVPGMYIGKTLTGLTSVYEAVRHYRA